MTATDLKKTLEEELTVPVWPTAGAALGLSRGPSL